MSRLKPLLTITQENSMQQLNLQLLSKPALLCSVCDEAEKMQKYPSDPRATQAPRAKRRNRTPMEYKRPFCTCSSSISHQVDYLSTRTFKVFRATSSPHQNYCPLHPFSKKRETFGIKFLFPGIFLTKLVHATLAISRGAGGMSISPNLSYHAIVSRESPGFRLISDTIELLIPGRVLHGWPESSSVVVEQTLQRFYDLFISGHASPHDTLENGDTLLHVSEQMELHGCQ
jgi:hypothetical protein